MRHGWQKLAGKTAAAVAILALMVGCSSNSPLAPAGDARSNLKGGTGADNNLAAQVEFASVVASTDVALRKLTFTGNSEIVFAAADAEIVRRQSGNETPITFAEIQVGDSVEVRGNRQGDNSVLANRIRVKVEDGNNAEVEFGGRVATIDADARTITFVNNPTLINVMAGAEIVNHDLQIAINLNDIVPGDSVEIRGTNQPNGSVLANRVRLRVTDGAEDADVEFKGAITSIDYTGSALTVSGRSETIVVTSTTQIFAKLDHSEHSFGKRGHGEDDGFVAGRDTAIAFTSLQVGDSVEVHADIVNATTLRAVTIEVEDFLFGEPVDVQFKAAIAAIDAGSRTVTFVGQSWQGTVSATAVLTGLNNEPLSLADFPIGQLVEVKGFPGTGTELTIVRMHKEDNI
ncbi:MAG: hypothetical protein IT585_12130 [candidate division Zixibacteria bacterium]|nr:hypothetical protein [candidate division Zixibacteria bacterium]